METKSLHFVGFGTAGNITYINNNYHDQYVRQISTNMRNPALFGSGGTVPFPGYTFTNQGVSNRTIPGDADIYQSSSSEVTATQAQSIKEWLMRSDKHIYLFTTMDKKVTSNSLTELTKTGVLPAGYVVGFTNLHAPSRRLLNQSSELTSTKLYNYLVKDGPFTEGIAPIEPEKIELCANTSFNLYLSEWPETFIPIIMSLPSVGGITGCSFGIDPTHRIIFLGDPQVFGNYGASSVNYSGSEQAPHNMKLLNNIIAWMTNAALYGDDFIDPFKIGNNE